MKPLVSLVIPVYNTEQYLDECLNSVTSQSYDNLEVIVVDDGSTDRSICICKVWAEKDSRIKLVANNHGGASRARNTGVAYSSGELIGFVDSDDIIDVHYVEKLVSLLKSNPDCSISTCCIQMYVDGKLVPFIASWQFEGLRYIEPYDFAERLMLMKSQHSSCGKLFKRELLEAVHYREGFSNEDILFFFDMIPYVEEHKVRTVELSDTLYFYRIRPGSTCSGDNTNMLAAEHKNIAIFIEATKDTRPVIYNHYYGAYLINTFYLINRYLCGMRFGIPISMLRTELRSFSNKYVRREVDGIKYHRFLFYKYFYHIAFLLYGVKRIVRSV